MPGSPNVERADDHRKLNRLIHLQFLMKRARFRSQFQCIDVTHEKKGRALRRSDLNPEGRLVFLFVFLILAGAQCGFVL